MPTHVYIRESKYKKNFLEGMPVFTKIGECDTPVGYYKFDKRIPDNYRFAGLTTSSVAANNPIFAVKNSGFVKAALPPTMRVEVMDNLTTGVENGVSVLIKALPPLDTVLAGDVSKLMSMIVEDVLKANDNLPNTIRGDRRKVINKITNNLTATFKKPRRRHSTNFGRAFTTFAKMIVDANNAPEIRVIDRVKDQYVLHIRDRIFTAPQIPKQDVSFGRTTDEFVNV